MTELDQAALVREDARLVAAAANDGRISVDNAPNWMMAMKADRAGTRKTLASLTSVRAAPFPASGVGADVEQIHNAVMGRLGIKPAPAAPRTVAASASPVADARERAILDDLGLPIAQVPNPVRLIEGKDPATWTQQERDDAALWALGPAFRAGLKPPPGTARIYQPSPNDHMEFVDGQWRAKSDYQGRA
jgi:hypothetical protein